MNLYVDSTLGNDSNSGTFECPLATLAAAHAAITDGAGGTISLRAGTYTLASWTKGGSPWNPLVIQSYPSERAIVRNCTTAAWTNIGGGIWQCTPPDAWVRNISGNFGSVALNGTVTPINDRPCVMAPDLSHLKSPTTIHGASFCPIADVVGNMMYNTCFYDVTANVLYFRSCASTAWGSVPVTDPNTQLMLSTGQVSIEASANYYQFRDLDFRHAQMVHQQAGGPHTASVFNNCTFKYMQMGIVGGGKWAMYTNNWVDKCGAYLQWYGSAATGNYNAGNQYHSLYLNGDDMLIDGNVLSRQCNGYLLQLQMYGGMRGKFTNNIGLLCNVGMAGVIQGDGWAFNGNVLLGTGDIAPYIGAVHFSMVGNFIEQAGILFNEVGPGPFNFTGGFRVTDNVCNGIKLYGPITPALSLIDRNLYVSSGRPRFDIGGGLLPSPITGMTFAQWRTHLQDVTGCSAWDANSQTAAGMLYSTELLNEMLDTRDYAAIVATCRDYARTFCAFRGKTWPVAV